MSELQTAWILLALALVTVVLVGRLLLFVVLGLYRGWHGSERINQPGLQGCVAQVSLPIPAGGQGKILLDQAGRRLSVTARAEHGQRIEAGVEVVVIEILGHCATVAPLE